MTMHSQAVLAEQRTRRVAGHVLRQLGLAALIVITSIVAALFLQSAAAAQESRPSAALADSANATNAPLAPADTRATGSVVWARRPTSSDVGPFGRMHPPRSGGVVGLACTIRADLTADCAIESESPTGQEYGLWALRASNGYSAQPTLSDGTSAVGATTRIVVRFLPHGTDIKGPP